MSKISIIVPVYNSEKYLKKCLDSLVNQTFSDIEVIAIDDNSSDNSYEILSKYQQTYPNLIKLYQTPINSGAATTRNLGLDVATGDYIGFIDSDDYIAKDYFEKLYTACEFTNSQLARTNRKIVLKNIDVSFLGRSSFYDNFSVINPKQDQRYLITESPSVTNKLIKKELIGERRFPDGLKWEDYPFSIPLLVGANQVAIVPGKNYFYQLHLSQTTATDARKLNAKMLDIFTGSDMIGKECLTPLTNENVAYQINYVQIMNCVQRLKEITSANIPEDQKRELLTMFAKLIEVKYGDWKHHPLQQEQKEGNITHKIMMHFVEKNILPNKTLPAEETELKQLIKTSLNKNTK